MLKIKTYFINKPLLLSSFNEEYLDLCAQEDIQITKVKA